MESWAEFFVFSFNRGPYLANCIESLIRNAPSFDVTIVDDGSTDAGTLAVLEASPFPVVRLRSSRNGGLGGLYANMQWALDRTRADVAIFLQDDVQLVRPVDASDQRNLTRYFAADPRNAFVSVLFPMGPRIVRERRGFKPYPGHRGYLYDDGALHGFRTTRRYFYDISAFSVTHLRSARWRYRCGENANAVQASRCFAPMLHYADPFVCQLPEVPTLRFGRRTLGAAWAERLSGPDILTFYDLRTPEIDMLRGRQVAAIATAGEVLHTRKPSVRRPFVHKSVKAYALPRVLDKVELHVRRWMSQAARLGVRAPRRVPASVIPAQTNTLSSSLSE